MTRLPGLIYRQIFLSLLDISIEIEEMREPGFVLCWRSTVPLWVIVIHSFLQDFLVEIGEAVIEGFLFRLLPNENPTKMQTLNMLILLDRRILPDGDNPGVEAAAIGEYLRSSATEECLDGWQLRFWLGLTRARLARASEEASTLYRRTSIAGHQLQQCPKMDDKCVLPRFLNPSSNYHF